MLDVHYYHFMFVQVVPEEITEHWEWLEQNLLQTPSLKMNDITTFVRGKIQVVFYFILFIYFY